MISVAEAQQAILALVSPGPVRRCGLADALGRTLAVAPRAVVDSPAFDNSAMDGFAVCHEMTAAASAAQPLLLPLTGEQLAGPVVTARFDPRTAWRITTGAPVPAGATAVVPLEDVEERDGTIVLRAPMRNGAHLRRRAEETRAGEVAFAVGVPLTAAAVGYLASIGVAAVDVYERPRVAIVPTGSELVPLGQPLQPGQLYESNSVALRAALTEFGIRPIVHAPTVDDVAAQRVILSQALDTADVVLVTGGVSVGQADYVKGLLAELGVEAVFWKVRQKPGKPIYCGRRGRQLVFGLPGNPVSSLTCYYEYVRLAIGRWMGIAEPQLPQWVAELTESITKRAGMTHFLRARTNWVADRWTVTPLGVQESHRLRPFAEANALIVLPEDCTDAVAGSRVCVQQLPIVCGGDVA
ncbi:MAG: molybdopterin molybdotransferase MoeA [Deltaproteobacteria bacterium]|nr:molybdopterin molybdotransferase MoeA [Deltaproteobacteria bacterium]